VEKLYKMSNKENTKQFEFQAEIKQLMHILAHSLYKNREVFLRELISNAADALEKARFHILNKAEEVQNKDLPLEIRIEPDEKNLQLTIIDTGIGMTQQELIDNIGQIAHSGSQDFLKNLTGDTEKDINLIGQFGVGFYSAFMVADQIDVISKSYLPNELPHKWSSKGEGQYTIEPIESAERGTKIVVHLREDAKDFLEQWNIESIIKKYSNFIPVPIKLEGKQINQTKAIWAEPKSSLKEEDYTEFYKFLTNLSDEPLSRLHLMIDMPVQFHALLYIPKTNPEILGFGKVEHRTHLYARRVMIQQNSEDILPDYLRFIRGVVDCDDLPLNVSRETLQENKHIARVRKAIVGKILSHFSKTATDEPDKYKEFWGQFGRIFKEGYTDYAHQEKFKPLLRFGSSMAEGDDLVSLDDYTGRMTEGQSEIYYLSAQNRATIDKSPHLEIFRKKGIEVLFLYDPLDEFVLSGLNSYMDKEFKSADQADLEKIANVADKQPNQPEEQPAPDEVDLKKLLDHIKITLGQDKVKEVRISKRLTDSPVVLVNSEDSLSSHMQRMMNAMNQKTSTGARIMEVNPKHPLIGNLVKLYQKNPRMPFIDQVCWQLYDNALFLEGFPPDPHEMVPRMQQMLTEISNQYAPEQ